MTTIHETRCDDCDTTIHAGMRAREFEYREPAPSEWSWRNWGEEHVIRRHACIECLRARGLDPARELYHTQRVTAWGLADDESGIVAAVWTEGVVESRDHFTAETEAVAQYAETLL